MEASFYGATEGGPPSYFVQPLSSTLPAGAMVLALQTQDASNNWNDIAVTSLPATPLHASETSNVFLTVSASIPTDTAVRAELRSGADYSKNSAFFTVIDGTLVVPECIPDMSNPGTCLP